MPHEFRGDLLVPKGRLGIVVASWNNSVTSKLLTGALETLRGKGVPDEAVDVCWVPGAFEIPTIAGRLVRGGRHAAVICLAAVIRGETTHDQHINRAVSLSLAELGRDSGVPVLFGILTCDTLEQAIHRSGGNVGNKGSECALAALEMASLVARLK